VYLFFVKIQNNYKKYKINTNAISQKYKIQKNTNQKFQKYKIQTKKYEPKISKIQNTKNTNSKMGQRANPMFILKSKNQLVK
jgi:hypothetical protein